MNDKQDWIIANINNPGFSAGDFKSIGLTTSDMQLRPIDDYLKSSQITENPLFKDDNGNFSKSKFEDFYNQSVSKYQRFSQDFDTFKYSLFDPFRKVDSEVRDPQLALYQVSNPEHSTIGIVGRNKVGKGDFTQKELAQQSKVFDPSTGQYLEHSVDEMSLFERPLNWVKNLFSDPIVYATYDSDGTHIDPITKREVEHKKGEFRINSDGEFFTEKLSGQNIRGKEIVSVMDNITSDTSVLNKYDFFDADGFDKSVTGSLFNAAASIAPLFIPGFGEVYSGFLVTRELGKALPMLSGMFDSVFGTEIQDNSLLNAFAGKMESLTGGTSEYAREKMFSFENISKLVSDVATQWGQQKVIAKGINKLTGAENLMVEANANAAGFYRGNTLLRGNALKQAVESGQMTEAAAANQLKVMSGITNLNELDDVMKSGKWMESALGKGAMTKFVEPAKKAAEGMNRLAANMSLGYMAIVSNTDVYQTLLDHGTTKGEAALFSFASTLGMYGVDRYLGLGELFFDELKNSNKYVRRNIEEMLRPWEEGLQQGVQETKSNYAKRIIDRGRAFGKQYVGKYISDLKDHTTGFLGKAFGEGLEEVSEELVTDFTKSLYEQLGKYGITSQEDVGAWDNMGSRYLMSFLGGSLGGGIFYGVGLANGQYPIQSSDEDILFHIRNGKTKDYLKMVDEWEKSGKFGSKELSATKYREVTEDGQTKKVYLTASDENDSQNHFIAQRVREGISQLDAIIRGNELNINDDQLFENLIMSEQRYMDMKDWLKDKSYATSYYDTYQNLVKRIADVEQQLQLADKTIDGTPTGEQLVNSDEWLRNNKDTEEGRLREDNLKKLREQKDLLIKQKNDFLSADTSYYYTRKMLFALDRDLAGNFFPTSFDEFLKQQKNVDSQDGLNDVDRQTYLDEYIEYQKSKEKETIDEQFDKFLTIEQLVSPHIAELETNSQNFKDYSEKIFSLFTENSPLNLNQIDYFSRLEGETDEDVQRFKKINEERVVITQSDLDEIDSQLSETLDDDSWRQNVNELRTGVNAFNNIKSLYNLLQDSPLKQKLGDYLFHQERIDKINEINKQKKQEAYSAIISTIQSLSNKLDPIAYRYLISGIEKRKRDAIAEIIDSNVSKIGIVGLSRQDKANIISIINEIKVNRDGTNNIDEIAQRLHQFLNDINAKDLEIKTETLNKIQDYFEQEFMDLISNSESGESTYLTLQELMSELENFKTHQKDEDGQVSSDKIQQLTEFIDLINTVLIDYINNYIEGLLIPEETISILKSIVSQLKIDINGNTNAAQIEEDIIAAVDPTIANKVNEFIRHTLTDITYGELIELKSQSDQKDSIDIESYSSILNQILESVNQDLQEDQDINTINQIESTARELNPFIEFVKKVDKDLGIEGIEDTLNELFEAINYNLEKVSDFRLTTEQEEVMEKVANSMKLVQAYLLAASKSSTIINPYGHNRSINEYIRNHSSKLKTKPQELPEISDETFIIWGQELQKYNNEIQSRIELSKTNSVNKERRFINTDEKFTKARLDFFETIAPHLKFTIDDKEVDLLEGSDQIDTTDEKLRLDLLEELLFNNFNKLLSSGYSLEQIFESSQILDKLTKQSGRESFIQQLSTRLDEDLDYSNFTLYDRLIYFLSTVGLNNREWNKFILEEISPEKNSERRIVPLTVQQFVSKVGTSFLNNQGLFESAFNYLINKGIIDKEKINVLSKSVFISGIGGAGNHKLEQNIQSII